MSATEVPPASSEANTEYQSTAKRFLDATPVVILNAHAGGSSKQPVESRLWDLFAAQGFPVRLLIAPDGGAIAELAHQAVSESAGVLVAGGGDGTVNAVAAVALANGRTLGVLPLGTLNHFAKDLGISQDLEGAVRVLANGGTRQVDVGEVNGHLFLNNSSLGLYPAVVHHSERLQDRFEYRKWPAFFWAAASALQRYPFVSARIVADGEPMSRRAPFIFIGNNAYHRDGLNLGGRESLDSGWLWLYTAHRAGRRGLLRFAWRACTGRLSEETDFDVRCAKEITIDTRYSTARVATDGEVNYLETPLRYRIHPRALAVIAPDPGSQVKG